MKNVLKIGSVRYEKVVAGTLVGGLHYTDNILYTNNKSVTGISSSLVHEATSPPRSLLVSEAVSLLVSRGVIDQSRAESILSCDPSRSFGVVCNSCGVYARIRAGGCKSRLCPHCFRSRRNKLYRRLEGVFSSFNRLRFLTIGFRNVESIDKAYFKECSEAFERYRRILAKQGYQFGTYVNVLEVKYHKAGTPRQSRADGSSLGVYESSQWNVHYHVLFDGDYIPQDVAQNAFVKATRGDSFYVYIKACRVSSPVERNAAALRYVIKYLGKIDGHDGDPLVLASFYEATVDVRFYNVGLKKIDRDRRQPKHVLTCAHCNGQSWLTEKADPVQFAKCVEGREPVDDMVLFMPRQFTSPITDPLPSSPLAVSFDYCLPLDSYTVLAALSDPVNVQHLSVTFGVDPVEVRRFLRPFLDRGEVVEPRPDLFLRV